VLKALGFLSPDGAPTDRYYRYLDQTEAPKVMAEGLRDAYGDLFQLNRNAQNMSKAEVKNKLKTLSQGQGSDDVLGKMATTFVELAKRGDFSAPTSAPTAGVSESAEQPAEDAPTQDPVSEARPTPAPGAGVSLGGLVYNIQIHLPDTRDQAVYDALFRSLKSHLLQ
jgi:hypothetical protein